VNHDYFFYILKETLKIPSPSGMTRAAIEFIENEIGKLGLRCTRTKKGAIYTALEGKTKDRARMLVAHIDTLGAIVYDIRDDGRLSIRRIGGVNCGGIEHDDVDIYTRNHGILHGTGIPEKQAVHVFALEAHNLPRLEQNMVVRLDIRTNSRQETLAAGINIGDMITFPTNTEIIENGFIKSKFIDDKGCLAIEMALLEEYVRTRKTPEYTTYFFISDYEEVGHGLYSVPEDTFEVVAIDVGSVGGNHPSSEYQTSIIAKDKFTVYDFDFRRKLEKLAEENDIAFCTEIYDNYGSDASVAVTQGFDFRFACLGPGVDATHHYERTHVSAIENTYKLLDLYLTSK